MLWQEVVQAVLASATKALLALSVYLTKAPALGRAHSFHMRTSAPESGNGSRSINVSVLSEFLRCVSLPDNET